jgi:thymidylate kinase
MANPTDQGEIIPATLIWLFDRFEELNIGYCILRNHAKIPWQVGNDVDILVRSQDYEVMSQAVNRCATKYGWELYQKTDLYFILYKFAGDSWVYLRLDFVNDLECRGLPYFPGDSFINARQQREDGIYILPPTLEFVHLLVHGLFGPNYNKDRYLEVLSRKLVEGNVDIEQARKYLRSIFPVKATDYIVDCLSKRDVAAIFERTSILWWALLRKNNLGHEWIRRQINKWWDRVRRTIDPSGLFVVLVGPDGVGKSTTAEVVTNLLQITHQTVKHSHLGFRPHILPTKRELGLENNGNSSMGEQDVSRKSVGVPNLVRLLYRTSDYILGYFLRIRPLLVRGGVFIAERYYYDYLVHPSRKGINISDWFIRLLFMFVPKPELMILLHADAAAIYDRRDELDIPEIERQLCELEKMGNTVQHFSKVSTDAPPEKVATKIMDAIHYILVN